MLVLVGPGSDAFAVSYGMLWRCAVFKLLIVILLYFFVGILIITVETPVTFANAGIKQSQ